MNYKYKLYNDVFILSEDEHNKVQDAISKGNDLIRLRGNSLIINMKHITSVTETDTLLNETPNVLKIEAPKPDQEKIKPDQEKINQRLDEMKKYLWEKWGLSTGQQ